MTRKAQPTSGNAVTLMDVACAANVSRATASLVVRGSPRVAAATRERVEEAMRRLGYVYNRSAAGLRSSRSGVLGVMLPGISNPFFAEFLEGIETVLQGAGLTNFLVISGEEAASEGRILRLLFEHGCDGLAICPPQDMQATSVQSLLRSGLSVVQAMREISDQFDYVGPDYAAGMRLAVDHLAGLGHRHFAFVETGFCHSATRARTEALSAALGALGLPPAIILRAPAPEEDGSGLAEAIDNLRRDGVTAAICFNDLIALSLCGSLADRGVRVGRDFSVVGFDGMAMGQMVRPRLTTIGIQPRSIGRAVAERLVARIGDRQLAVARTILPVRLIAGDTTGPRD
ncbi:LacI family DNA-binding transcriptional regulator [Paenirhodobacter populi]|uniref:LacI family transcriptional regulator n=1 Tax=Paenirhodobacter populi TaxID=2306993 RepID=A0A443J7Z0_9RHOB|nr:LacI family DNA-binding transcriptional regulator [Sinirhodobacter populi]RWR16585.1 LacI family transcriptional regulator [Sinirhodobacter populi]